MSITHRLCRRAAAIVLGGCIAIAAHADATDHTWTGISSNGWFDANNWTNGVPVAGDTAIFSSLAAGASSTPTIGPGETVDLGSLLFPASAPAYQFNIAAGAPDFPGSLTLSGAGISNSSSVVQTLNIDGMLRFVGNASGAKTALIANAGATVDISGLSAAGTTVNSIAGAGSYILGGKNLTLDPGNSSSNTTVSGIISGVNGIVTKFGNGTLTLSGTNTFSGGFVLKSGSVFVNNSAALGTGVFSISGVGVGSANASAVIPNASNLGGQVFFAPVDSPPAELEFAGPVNLVSNSLLRAGSAGTVRFSNSIAGVSKSLTFQTDVIGVPGSFVFSGSLSNTYTGSTTVHSQTGPITLMLAKTAGATAIPSDLFIYDHDTVRLAQPEQIADTARVTLYAGSILDLDGYNETISAIFSDPGATFLGGRIALNSASRAGTLTVGSGTLLSDISDGGFGGNLIKTSTGQLILWRESTYTGTTLVSAGTLLAGNGNIGSATGSGSVTVEPGASLAGWGTIGGPALIKDQAILSPYQFGPLTFRSQLTLSNDSQILMQLPSANDFLSQKNSEVMVLGQLTLDGTLVFDLTHGFGGKGDYLLFTYFGALIDDGLKIGTPPTGFGPSDFLIDTSQPGKVILRVLPEPTSLLSLLLIPLFLRRRHRTTHF